MNRYDVRITDRALEDMEGIYDYIAFRLQAPETAMGQYNRIAEAIESLSQMPERCKLFDSQQERDMGMRQRLIDHYTAVFVIDENDKAVIVLRVLYAASDINKRLRDGH